MKLRVSQIKIHLFAINFAFELEEKNERLETGSYIFAYSERGWTASTLRISGSSGFFLAISKGLQFISEVIT